MDREKVIVKVSIQGIIVNVILVVFKAFVGMMANSIAIILDAVNNLTDALSQVITIAGTKLSQKEPDKEHPYGYGRIEYISAIIVAALVIFAGVTSLKESAIKVIHPAESEYSTVSLIIIAVAVVVKFIFGRYVKAKGESVDSQALVASGTDAFMDSILSFSTFVTAIITKLFGLSLEGIVGVVLSAFIIKAGLEILKETLGSLIGDRTDSELSGNIKRFVREMEGVNGAYDLVLHDYGPSRSMGSIHVEVDEEMSAKDIHLLTRRIMYKVYEEFGIVLTVGIYATNNNDAEANTMLKAVMENALSHEHVIQMHGFYVDYEEKHMAFDILISHSAPSYKEIMEAVKNETMSMYPDYTVDVAVDHDYSD